MPIFFQQQLDADTSLAVWHIAEPEEFFLEHVPLQRQITHPHKRLQHLAGRYLLQWMAPDFPLNLIKIADTRKPFLEGDVYHFSVSHCDNYAAAIVSKSKRVGVDIERPTQTVLRISNKFLHPEELAWSNEAINGDPSTDQPINLLTLLWSAKEAVFKWWSYGNVDFSEMIRLEPVSKEKPGLLSAKFIEAQTHALLVHYRLFDDCCLAWVAE